LLADGAPKNAVSEPCLSFFGADGDATVEEMDEAAFRLTFISVKLMPRGWNRQRGGVGRGPRTERHLEMNSNLTCITKI
jgi:hypothetical protein